MNGELVLIVFIFLAIGVICVRAYDEIHRYKRK